MKNKSINQYHYDLKHPNKYIGNYKNVIARSKLEHKWFSYIDTNPKFISWASEEFYIPYLSPFDQKMHKYYIDLFFSYKKENKIIKWLAEIKPLKNLKRPTKQGQRMIEYIINIEKWKATFIFCNNHALKFCILTDNKIIYPKILKRSP